MKTTIRCKMISDRLIQDGKIFTEGMKINLTAMAAEHFAAKGIVVILEDVPKPVEKPKAEAKPDMWARRNPFKKKGGSK